MGSHGESESETLFIIDPHTHSGTIHTPKISGTCTARCKFLFRAIVKRHAMTGSRLGHYAEIGQPPGFRRRGGIGSVKFPMDKLIPYD